MASKRNLMPLLVAAGAGGIAWFIVNRGGVTSVIPNVGDTITGAVNPIYPVSYAPLSSMTSVLQPATAPIPAIISQCPAGGVQTPYGCVIPSDFSNPTGTSPPPVVSPPPPPVILSPPPPPIGSPPPPPAVPVAPEGYYYDKLGKLRRYPGGLIGTLVQQASINRSIA